MPGMRITVYNKGTAIEKDDFYESEDERKSEDSSSSSSDDDDRESCRGKETESFTSRSTSRSLSPIKEEFRHHSKWRNEEGRGEVKKDNLKKNRYIGTIVSFNNYKRVGLIRVEGSGEIVSARSTQFVQKNNYTATHRQKEVLKIFQKVEFSIYPRPEGGSYRLACGVCHADGSSFQGLPWLPRQTESKPWHWNHEKYESRNGRSEREREYEREGKRRRNAGTDTYDLPSKRYRPVPYRSRRTKRWEY